MFKFFICASCGFHRTIYTGSAFASEIASVCVFFFLLLLLFKCLFAPINVKWQHAIQKIAFSIKSMQYCIAAVQSLVFYELKVVTGAQVENLCNLFHNYFRAPANARFRSHLEIKMAAVQSAVFL